MELPVIKYDAVCTFTVRGNTSADIQKAIDDAYKFGSGHIVYINPEGKPTVLKEAPKMVELAKFTKLSFTDRLLLFLRKFIPCYI